jgi:hypothetical protein
LYKKRFEYSRRKSPLLKKTEPCYIKRGSLVSKQEEKMKLVISPEDKGLVHSVRQGRLDRTREEFTLRVGMTEWIHFIDKGQRSIIATGISEESIGEVLAGLQTDYGLLLTKLANASDYRHVVFENLSLMPHAVTRTRTDSTTPRR